MEAQTLYKSPESQLETTESSTQDPVFFSFDGRIGRLRYMAYSFGMMILLGTLIGVGAAVLSVSEIMGGALLAISTLSMIIASFVYMRRRLNDMNYSGWFGLLMIIPLVSLILTLMLMFVPGTKETNNFGAKPSPNSILLTIVGLILPVIFTVGIFAAVALPAYQDYVSRAGGL